MSDNKPDSEQTSLTNRPIVAGTTVSSTDHEAWRNDLEGTTDDLIAGLKDNSNHRAGTSAPTDNAVEGQIWANTTTDPAKLYADLDGAGADTQIITTDDSASATAEGISELATIAEIDTGADAGRTITPAGLAGSALQTTADGAVPKSTYNAQSVLVAVSDNTPVAQAVAASEFVGRKAAGNVGAMSKAEALAVLNVEDGADVTDATNVNAAGAVMEADYDAQTILMAAADDTPAAVTMGASTFAGRKAAGNVGAMSVAEALAVLGVEAGALATRILNANTTQVGNVGAGEDDLMSYTLPAGKLASDGNALRITAWGTTATAGKTVTVKFYFGSAALSVWGSFGDDAWFVDCIVSRVGANSQTIIGFLKTTNYKQPLYVIGSEAMSGSIVLKMTGENTTDATNDAIQQSGMLVELMA